MQVNLLSHKETIKAFKWLLGTKDQNPSISTFRDQMGWDLKTTNQMLNWLESRSYIKVGKQISGSFWLDAHALPSMRNECSKLERDYPRQIQDLISKVTEVLNEDQSPELWYFVEGYGWFGWWNKHLSFLYQETNPNDQNKRGEHLLGLQKSRRPLVEMNYHVQKGFLNILPDFLAMMKLEKAQMEDLPISLMEGYEALKDFQKDQ